MIFKKRSLLATIAAMFLGSMMFIACSDDDTPPVDDRPFVAVTGITLTSATSTPVNAPLQLTATISPANATNRSIVWSGEGVSGGRLTATEPGVAQVTATIINGRAQGENYDTTFSIVVTQGFNPNATNVVLLDDFKVRSLDFDDPDSYTHTNQNALMMRDGVGDNAGSWYAFANSENDMEWGGSSEVGYVFAFPDFDEENILSGSGNSSTAASMLKVLGSDSMIVSLDVLEAANAGDGYYYATVETPFIRSGTNAIPVDLSGLQAVRLRTQLKGVLNVVITSPTNATGSHSQWGWTIGTQNPDGTNDWETIEVTLNVSDMIQTNGATVADRDASLANADTFSFQLNTSEGTRVDMKVDDIYLIFTNEAAIPSQFGTKF